MNKWDNVFRDPHPDQLILNKVAIPAFDTIKHLTLTDFQFDDLFNLFFVILRKLAAIYNHLNNYKEIEKKAILNVKILDTIDTSSDLYIEFDEFVVQIKSLLDHQVKILKVILGNKCWNLGTFSNEGSGVIKALQNNVPVNLKHKGKILIKVIIDSSEWIKNIVKIRDKINHCLDNGININYFKIYRSNGDDNSIKIPMMSPSLSVSQWMENSWFYAINFTEIFSISSILFAPIKKGVTILYDGRRKEVSKWVILPNPKQF
jgi:hypothetical protein